MNQNETLRDITRRHFFQQCPLGIGALGLASLLNEKSFAAPAASEAPRTHFAPRAKNVIYLFMAGGPSQLELFDYKPKLVELTGQPIRKATSKASGSRL